MPFSFERLAIADVVAIQPKVFQDDRGVFAEVYQRSSFASQGIVEDFVQYNYSRSERNVLRGLHFQLDPAAQGKLLRVTRGNIFDVAVDIRRSSKSFGTWVSARLSSQQGNMLYIPAGFAHGFCVLSDLAEVVYYCTAEYAPDLERGIIWNDPAIGIDWPLEEPILSEKDKKFPQLRDVEQVFD